MNFSNLLNNLNDKQREAVLAPYGNLLVLAGAGSGKTQVLVYRIAWLLSNKNYSPYSFMAVTFTNKASAEMRYRIEHLVKNSQRDMWIGTFHGLAHRLLRTHYCDVNLPKDFQIIDCEDQCRFLKRIISNMNLDDKKWSPQKAMWYINEKKDNGFYPNKVNKYGPVESTWQRIYHAYQDACDRAGLVDFSELLLRTYQLWLNNPDILNYYHERFINILVDEFQDTNRIQYALIRMLAGNDNNVMIVGDDDQSIYSWRGAQIENIHHFIHDFPSVQTIRLEQNYRSTKNILKAANTLIAHNDGRLGKNLWTDRAQGELITLYCALNELDEARFIVHSIKENKEKGGMLKDCAILYRKNAQSRILEEALLRMDLSYRIYGGTRFFERQEIRDALAYLRLLVNRNDDAAYERIVNTPTRGLGHRTLNIVHKIARDRHLTLWQSSQTLISDNILDNRATAALKNFLNLIDMLDNETAQLPLHIQADQVVKQSGLLNMYKKEKGEKGQSRIENIEELVTALYQFKYNEKDKNISPLQAFLSHVALEDEDNERDSHISQDAVQLMTLHSAKGMEFPYVFIIGMEEGIFPNKTSLNKEDNLEEERRLAYVGVTRAMKKLTITYTESRWLYGKEIYHRPSRFIYELPTSCIQEVRLRSHTILPFNYNSK